jgi:hypothetical protein
MTIIDDLVAFASEAKATVSETPGGHSMTWDHGMYAHHLWTSEGEWFYGKSERGSSRIPTMITPHLEIAVKWAISRIGADVRAALGLPWISIPNTLEEMDPGWQVQQISLITGRLVRDGGLIPMELRSIFPQCHNLAECSHLLRLPMEQLLESYRTPDGNPLLGEYVRQ